MHLTPRKHEESFVIVLNHLTLLQVDSFIGLDSYLLGWLLGTLLGGIPILFFFYVAIDHPPPCLPYPLKKFWLPHLSPQTLKHPFFSTHFKTTGR